MLFTDDQARDEFHKAKTLLQIICSVVDFECAKHEIQLDLIGCELGTTAIMHAPGMNPETVKDICSRVDAQFKRKDGKPSCWVSDLSLNFLKCYATSAEDLLQLN